MLKYKIPQIVTLIHKIPQIVTLILNPPKSLIYSKKRGKSLLKFLFLLGD